MKEKKVEIFTDGCCSGNPGIGGWGAVLRFDKIEKALSGIEAYTTNNRMEMTAAIKSLMALKFSCKIIIATDSTYLKDGITGWIEAWKRNGWKTKEKTLVKNIDLWKQLDLLMTKHQVEWSWIKGHAGHRENEMADQLARNAVKAYIQTLGIDGEEQKQQLLF